MTKRQRVFLFSPVGWDLYNPHSGTPKKNAKVVKYQPYGCPRNGTMGHCFVADAETGERYGLVQEGSLMKTPHMVNLEILLHGKIKIHK